MKPNEMGIIEVDGAFRWSVGFEGDSRLPRMGTAASFEKADAAVRACIKAARTMTATKSVDRRPAGVTP